MVIMSTHLWGGRHIVFGVDPVVDIIGIGNGMSPCWSRHQHDTFLSVQYLDILILLYFLENMCLDISCESSAKQVINMKCQDLFS